MRRRLVAAAVVALGVAASPSGAGAFVPNGVQWPEELRPIPVFLHNSGINNLTVDDLEAIVLESFEEWERVACSEVAFDYQGRTEALIEINETQVLEWIEEDERWIYGSMSAGATIIYNFDNPETPERERPLIDIAFNGVDFRWVVGGAGIQNIGVLDPLSVITHELGHFLGLNHTRTDNLGTMFAAYLPDGSQRTLGRDDKIGICEVYWTTQDECQVDGDCRERELCEPYTSEAHGQTVNICGEVRGTFGDFCSAQDLFCSGRCLFTEPNFSGGFCTEGCETNADCPCGWSCRNIQTVNNPLLVCRQEPPDPGEDPCAQADPEPDAGQPDAGEPDASEPEVQPDREPDAGQSPEDEPGADPEATPAPRGDDCLCSSTAAPRGTPWALLVLAAPLFPWLRRRRKTS